MVGEQVVVVKAFASVSLIASLWILLVILHMPGEYRKRAYMMVIFQLFISAVIVSVGTIASTRNEASIFCDIQGYIVMVGGTINTTWVTLLSVLVRAAFVNLQDMSVMAVKIRYIVASIWAYAIIMTTVPLLFLNGNFVSANYGNHCVMSNEESSNTRKLMSFFFFVVPNLIIALYMSFNLAGVVSKLWSLWVANQLSPTVYRAAQRITLYPLINVGFQAVLMTASFVPREHSDVRKTFALMLWFLVSLTGLTYALFFSLTFRSLTRDMSIGMYYKYVVRDHALASFYFSRHAHNSPGNVVHSTNLSGRQTSGTTVYTHGSASLDSSLPQIDSLKSDETQRVSSFEAFNMHEGATSNYDEGGGLPATSRAESTNSGNMTIKGLSYSNEGGRGGRITSTASKRGIIGDQGQDQDEGDLLDSKLEYSKTKGPWELGINTVMSGMSALMGDGVDVNIPTGASTSSLLKEQLLDNGQRSHTADAPTAETRESRASDTGKRAPSSSSASTNFRSAPVSIERSWWRSKSSNTSATQGGRHASSSSKALTIMENGYQKRLPSKGDDREQEVRP